MAPVFFISGARLTFRKEKGENVGFNFPRSTSGSYIAECRKSTRLSALQVMSHWRLSPRFVTRVSIRYVSQHYDLGCDKEVCTGSVIVLIICGMIILNDLWDDQA